MVDIHAHLLPKMDDGSKSVAQTAEMLTCMGQQGVETVVATSHFDMRNENIEKFLQRREKSYQSLKEAGGDSPEIILGAEVLYCGVGLSRIEGIERLCIGDGRYLLVETLGGRWKESFADHMQHLMLEQDITPVLAHIERYVYNRKNRKILGQLRNAGAVSQVNAEFFIEKRTRRRAIRWLKDGLIDVLGTDCHNLDSRKPNLAEAARVITEYAGEEMLRKLMNNAGRIVAGENL